MIAYKFLNPGGVGPYSGFAWPLPAYESPGAWVEAQGSLDLCRNGIHACRVGQLPYWWGVELWEVELDDPIEDVGRAVLARRGRLLESVEAWDEAMMRSYARACAWRARDHAVGSLAALGLSAAADALAACTDLDGLAVTATSLADTVPHEITATVAYTADAAAFSAGSMSLVKTVPYITAHTAGCTRGPEGGLEYEERYHAERKWQSTWFSEHLGLHTT